MNLYRATLITVLGLEDDVTVVVTTAEVDVFAPDERILENLVREHGRGTTVRVLHSELRGNVELIEHTGVIVNSTERVFYGNYHQSPYESIKTLEDLENYRKTPSRF